MKTLLRNITLICTLLFAGYAQSYAKETYKNILGVNDECYELYKQARQHCDTPECLEIYQKMVKRAVQYNDKSAICLAMSIPVIYYRLHGTEKQYFAKMTMMRNKAKYLQLDHYYYWCFNNEIQYYIEHNQSFKALNRVHEMIKNIGESETGAYSCYMAFGDVYMARRDEIHAKENYEKAMEISKRLDKPHNLTYVYLCLARITGSKKYGDREKLLLEGLQAGKNTTDTVSALMGLAYLKQNQQKDDEFINLYNLYKKKMEIESIAKRIYDKWYRSNDAYMLSLQGNNDSAYKVRQMIKDPYLRYQAHVDFYKSTGDNAQRELFLDSLTTYLRSSQTEQNVSDVAYVNALYENDRIKFEAEKKEERLLRTIHSITIAALLIITALLGLLIIWQIRKSRSLHKINKELNKARQEAIEANKMKDVFIQNMSHEIRTPLNAVSGFAQLLTLPPECFEEEERQEFGMHIHNNTNLLTMLIDDILNISDVESGNYKMVYNTYNVNEMVNTAVATIKYRIKEEITLNIDSEVDDDFTMVTDARRIQQVLINFLTNSIKHTDEGSINLKVSISEHPGEITFSVADTGTGIPKDKAELIFNRFEKLNAFKQGTGLGLNICRIISEKLNGRCYLDTTYPDAYPGVEHGARFVFTLPLENEKAKEE